ncbi:unnamed protein product [Caenorhabditis auriculariae]|uniref:Endonuclease/exonuclease/phosphatase domain-containing protein n=1 Tax=Caenorhabditis auriculariae TaxID=2777116 RepID=A0A8S1H0Q5_9PELO|nr:unnamed protein product [Caenorhabditis auriculariae]
MKTSKIFNPVEDSEAFRKKEKLCRNNNFKLYQAVGNRRNHPAVSFSHPQQRNHRILSTGHHPSKAKARKRTMPSPAAPRSLPVNVPRSKAKSSLASELGVSDNVDLIQRIVMKRAMGKAANREQIVEIESPQISRLPVIEEAKVESDADTTFSFSCSSSSSTSSSSSPTKEPTPKRKLRKGILMNPKSENDVSKECTAAAAPFRTSLVLKRECARVEEIDVVVISDDEGEVVCLRDATTVEKAVEVEIEEISSNSAGSSIGSKTEKIKQNDKKLTKKSSVLENIEDCLNKQSFLKKNEKLRFWETVQNPDAFSLCRGPHADFRVCSYNILCQDTISKTMYLYRHLSREQHLLNWEVRWQKLREELSSIDADVFGLQEVQECHFNDYIKPFFKKRGYAGLLKTRTGGLFIDGCAIFYKPHKFDILEYRFVEYFVAPNTNMDREQIAQIAKLRCRVTGEIVLFANTHLLFNKTRGDVKLGQLALLFANIHDMKASTGNPCSVIVTGDFNMEPNSAVYRYAANGMINLGGLPRRELSGQGEKGGTPLDACVILPPACGVLRDGMFASACGMKPNRVIAANVFCHPIKLHSVYTHGCSENSEVSTYHADSGNPDFIFYSVKEKSFKGEGVSVKESPCLKLMSRYSLPTRRGLRGLSPWPNFYVPSDHIPLIANFRLTGPSF